MQNAQTRLETLGASSPKMRAALAGRLASVKAEIANYKQGQVKIDGQWVSAAEIARRREAEEAAQQQAHDDAEGCELIGTLTRRDLSAFAYEQTTGRLKALRKGDDPAVQTLTARHGTDADAVAKLGTEARTFLQATSTGPAWMALTGAKDAGQLQTPPPETTRAAADLLAGSTSATAGSITRRWPMGCGSKVALISVLHLGSEISKYKSGSLQDAARELADDDSPPTKAFPTSGYPGLDAATKNVRGLVVAAQAFVEHCKRGQELEKLGNNADAIAEYRKATDIAKEPAILRRIQSLREQSLGL